MAKLDAKEFMEKVKAIIGERDDDEALSFLEDCKDTISSVDDDYKAKYDEAMKAKEDLDKAWREKYKARFYDTDDSPSKEHEKEKEKVKDPFDNRSDAQIEAENTTIDSLFTESEDN